MRQAITKHLSPQKLNSKPIQGKNASIFINVLLELASIRSDESRPSHVDTTHRVLTG
jgi:hypothetical protein